ncbi:MAG TPA: tetratricopeptide repeat protein [Thermoanaerobaculia bacterium]|nr:tetratricopeptide repeat protein [Thermoanaerobaculia bacterium]
MPGEHVSREVMQRFFRSELSRRDTHEVVRHLMRQCPTCLEVAVEVGAEEGYVYQEGDFQNALFPEDPERYDDVFQRLLGSVDEVRLDLARERLRGIGLWHVLEKYDQERRLAMIRQDPRMHTWGLYDRLLEQCRVLGFRAPASAAQVAELALTVVEILDPVRHGAARIADFRAGALAALGNAKRLASDFEGARRALRLAREELSRGTGDPLEEAHVLSLQASWHKDLGEFEEALEILDRAIAIYREINDSHMEGRALLKKADIFGYFQPERAIELAQEGLALIDPLREPRLEWCARHNLAYSLTDAGRPQEALVMLELSRPLYEQFQDPWTRVRLHWLEGKIARSLGDLAEAEEIFKRLWYDLQEPSQAHELTLVSLELAEVYVARGKHEEAAELVEEFLPLLRDWGMHAEGLALWLLMHQAVEERRAEAVLFRQMAEYLNRAWFRPLEKRDN